MKGLLVTLVLAALAVGAGGGYYYGQRGQEACREAAEAYQEFSEMAESGLMAIRDNDMPGMIAALGEIEAHREVRRERYGTSSLRTISNRCTS